MTPADAIIDYYHHAGDDYGYWSPSLHMHFGYWRPGLWPWQREPMLRAMAATVLDRLGLAAGARGTVADLGCGVGTTARELARRHAGIDLLAVTVVPGQVSRARALDREAGLEGRIAVQLADYRQLPVADGGLIGAYAIESACYDPSGGVDFSREVARALRPGAWLVVADAFRRRDGVLPRHAARCERGMCEGWVLPGLPRLDAFVAGLAAAGFHEIEVEDISMRVAPTLLQVPLCVLAFGLAQSRAGALHPRRRGNLSAPLWGVAAGLLAPRWFGYYLVRARRV